MDGHVLRAPDQERFLASMLHDQGRGVGMIAFDRCFVIARDLPAHFAGRFVKRGDPRLAVVHPDHDDIFFRQYWGCAVIPKERVPAEALDQIGLPTHLAVKLQRREAAALEIDEHTLAVRDR